MKITLIKEEALSGEIRFYIKADDITQATVIDDGKRAWETYWRAVELAKNVRLPIFTVLAEQIIDNVNIETNEQTI